jgi:hypothetical protein
MNYPIDPETHQYNHAEAFCLMLYHCQPSGKTVLVWNSRDGVTPFCMHLDGREYQHINWRSDRQLPEFQMTQGHLFFRDTTLEESVYFALRRIEMFQNTEYAIERNSPQWYQTWSNVTETFLQAPHVDRYDARPEWLDKAKQEGLWFYWSAENEWYTPDEFERDMGVLALDAEPLLYFTTEWELIHPTRQLKALKTEIYNHQEKLSNWEKRMREHGLEVSPSTE